MEEILLEIERKCRTILDSTGIETVDQRILPGRAPQYGLLPQELHPDLAQLVGSLAPGGLYTHQAEALAAVLGGKDVCLATATASGKSLVFIAAAAQFSLIRRTARTLAVYPARALIQDQVSKWSTVLGPLGLRAGVIDGGVPVDRREQILGDSSVVLMTPDVVHAWLMSNTSRDAVRTFLANLELLVLDEAHVYEGAFGTNMAYLLRRLAAVSHRYQLITSTATIDEPETFVELLTGRKTLSFDRHRDTSGSPEKVVLLATTPTTRNFSEIANLLRGLREAWGGRFLVFSDSRRLVEQLVAAASRRPHASEEPDEDHEDIQPTGVLPYRAGYESEDREQIQRALSVGGLAGVVCTSAMELGIDIGEVNLVVLLDVPSTMKAFWQRVGRAGRRSPAVCVLIDSRQTLSSKTPGALASFLNRPVERSWLYLDNRYIQYANALCAATEFADANIGADGLAHFETMPPRFLRLLENELNPTEVVPSDLYALKQRAQSGPHHEFPIRSATDKTFQVLGGMGTKLGTLTFGQVLREGYPGAVYFYMARPFRVGNVDFKKGEIKVRRERHFLTKPLAQTMVFPRFSGGVLNLRRGARGFLAEVELQVSERVTGFLEVRGSARLEHMYEVGSPYSQRPLTRFYETTGVCWWLDDKATCGDDVAVAVLEAFATDFGVQDRDLGHGLFVSKQSPLAEGRCQGACVYDGTNGSLRLTEKLFDSFADVVGSAERLFRERGEDILSARLGALHEFAQGLSQVNVEYASDRADSLVTDDSAVAILIAAGERGIYLSPSGHEELKVLGYRYTPQGLFYQVESPIQGGRRMVRANTVQPLNGETTMVQVNLMTGEEEPLEAQPSAE